MTPLHKALLVATLTMPLPAAAQEGPEWEAQRCIWRCLADSPGAASAEYNACVAATCNEPAAAPAPMWTGGITADGQGRFAGIADPATGALLYFMCAPGRPPFLMITGPEGPSATLTLDVDGQRFALPFTENGGSYVTPMPPGSPPLVAMVTGRRATFFNDLGTALVSVPLTAAMETMDRALMDCT